ncbi:MAG: hypothetical protein AAGU21_09655 [Solidesulfovibrio sp.]|uniref:hypothetical protein n=1 Tax=Solidesulfovibrio sp. TaxID=2910990 RepID=UPI002B2202DA|nr:hypothetical protein [Solidesulfovibrio sp.]MEA4858545.1 hypothetical protein [Solidesulfovibrio sp.]
MRNKPIVTVLLVLAVLALAAASGRAAELPPQLTVPPETLADEFLRGLSGYVALSPEELAAVRPILVEQTRKRQEIARARLAANPGLAGMLALREDMRAVTRETDTKLAAILAPEKLERIRAYREQRRDQAKAIAKNARQGG